MGIFNKKRLEKSYSLWQFSSIRQCTNVLMYQCVNWSIHSYKSTLSSWTRFRISFFIHLVIPTNVEPACGRQGISISETKISNVVHVSISSLKQPPKKSHFSLKNLLKHDNYHVLKCDAAVILPWFYQAPYERNLFTTSIKHSRCFNLFRCIYHFRKKWSIRRFIHAFCQNVIWRWNRKRNQGRFIY